MRLSGGSELRERRTEGTALLHRITYYSIILTSVGSYQCSVIMLPLQWTLLPKASLVVHIDRWQAIALAIQDCQFLAFDRSRVNIVSRRHIMSSLVNGRRLNSKLSCRCAIAAPIHGIWLTTNLTGRGSASPTRPIATHLRVRYFSKRVVSFQDPACFKIIWVVSGKKIESRTQMKTNFKGNGNALELALNLNSR